MPLTADSLINAGVNLMVIPVTRRTPRPIRRVQGGASLSAPPSAGRVISAALKAPAAWGDGN